MDNEKKDHFFYGFLGSALGTFVGDAMGEPIEGWSHKAIHSHFGLLDTMLRKEARYTDDTQMMIGILETLVERGAFDPALCAGKFQENFDPARGYGRRIHGVVERIREGTPWDKVGTDSFGNGGAMRVAPIGCFYYGDLKAMKEQAILSARITHNHSEGLAGAVVQATAVGLALELGLSKEPVSPDGFVERLQGQVETVDKVFAERLGGVTSLTSTFDSFNSEAAVNIIEAISSLYDLNLRAIESVPAAVGAFLLTDNLKDAVVLAVNLGGDTDTIGAMAGAIAGAYYGFSDIPEKWLRVLENGTKGRDYVVDCVRRIVENRRHS